jgi:hypothetical protein
MLDGSGRETEREREREDTREARVRRGGSRYRKLSSIRIREENGDKRKLGRMDYSRRELFVAIHSGRIMAPPTDPADQEPKLLGRIPS